MEFYISRWQQNSSWAKKSVVRLPSSLAGFSPLLQLIMRMLRNESSFKRFARVATIRATTSRLQWEDRESRVESREEGNVDEEDDGNGNGDDDDDEMRWDETRRGEPKRCCCCCCCEILNLPIALPLPFYPLLILSGSFHLRPVSTISPSTWQQQQQQLWTALPLH